MFRLEWMYTGASNSTVSLQEDYLLGKRKISESFSVKFPESLKQGKDVDKSSTRQLDLEQKAREDPLMVIKKRELEAAARSAFKTAKRSKGTSTLGNDKETAARIYDRKR